MSLLAPSAMENLLGLFVLCVIVVDLRSNSLRRRANFQKGHCACILVATLDRTYYLGLAQIINRVKLIGRSRRVLVLANGSLSPLTERLQMLCEEVFLHLEFAFMAAGAQKEVLVRTHCPQPEKRCAGSTKT